MSRAWRPFLSFRTGRSQRVTDLTAAHALVTGRYPGALMHGSMGTAHWRHGGEGPYSAGGLIVAEAIAAHDGKTWLLRIAQHGQEPPV